MSILYFVAWLIVSAVLGIATGFFIYTGEHDEDEDDV